MPSTLNMAEGITIATSLCLVNKVVHIDHLKNTICFVHSENGMYLTENPESSASYFDFAVNVNEWDAAFYSE